MPQLTSLGLNSGLRGMPYDRYSFSYEPEGKQLRVSFIFIRTIDDSFKSLTYL